MENSSLSVSVVKTISYFDIFQCPLTLEELYCYLWKPDPISYENFRIQWPSLYTKLSQEIEYRNGYVFLRKNSDCISQRVRRVWHVEKKLKKARQAARLIRWVPFVEAFFVCNQIEVGVTQKSDIDVLILITPGRMFFTRFMVTLVLTIFRLRRHKQKITDRICLSFYLTTDNLEFFSLQNGEEDIYLSYWMTQLIAVYDPKKYLQVIYEKNAWIKRHLPHAAIPEKFSSRVMVTNGVFSLRIKMLLEKIFHGRGGQLLENFFKNFQNKLMSKKNNYRKNSNNNVRISDTILKFHENDRRELFKEEWTKRWKTMLNVKS